MDANLGLVLLEEFRAVAEKGEGDQGKAHGGEDDEELEVIPVDLPRFVEFPEPLAPSPKTKTRGKMRALAE